MFQVRKDVRVEVRVRNNLVLKKMEEQGIFSVAELCRRMGTTNQMAVGMLINMKLPARTDRTGEWCPLAVKLSEFFACVPEDLFSDAQQRLKLERNRSHAEMAFHEVEQLGGGYRKELETPELVLQATELRTAIYGALRNLTPREERVIRLRFGLDTGEERTFAEIGEMLGITGGRVMQIEAKALRKLKHPARSGKIIAAGGAKIENSYDRGGVILDQKIIDQL